MKFHNIDSWHYDDSMNCMLFFASLVDEMSFNYTIDSYKAPIMTTLSLLEELYYNIEAVEEGLIADGAVNSIIEEVRTSIEEDEVFRVLLSDHKLSYVQELFKSDNKRDIKIAVDLLTSIPDFDQEYITNLKNTLSLLIKQNKEKKKIEQLTRLYITQLKNEGYSNEFIYHHNLRFFFSRDSIVNSVDQIDDYLSRFDFKPHSYKVICIGGPHFKFMRSFIRKMGDNVFDDYDFKNNGRYDQFKIDAKKNKDCFIEININAFDFYQARNNAYERIDRFCVLFSFFHHKSVVDVKDTCIAIDVNTNEYCLLKPPVRSIVKCVDLKPKAANKKFKSIAEHLIVDNDSMRRLLKSVWLHRQALMSESEENQFVNLFSALEVLMPKDIAAGKERIRQISDVLIPVLCLEYYHKLVLSLYQELYSIRPDIITQIEAEVNEGRDIIDKIAGMLCLEKYKPLRDKVYKELVDQMHVLAVHRIFRLSEIFKEPKSTLLFIIRHEKRLRQHIDRLYRTRNMIVHSGESHDNLGALLENLHFYFDVIVNAIFENNVNRQFSKLEFTFASSVVRYQQYKQLLEKERSFTDSNYIELIFAK